MNPAENLQEDFTGNVGIRWFRGEMRTLTGMRTWHPTLLLPLAETVVKARVAKSPDSLLDITSFLVVPGRHQLELELASPTVQLLWIEFHPDAMAPLLAQYPEDVEATRLSALLQTCQKLPRTVWVHELVQRYLFERLICGKHESVAAGFLEVELLKELYFLAKEAAAEHERTSMAWEMSPLLNAALADIERALAKPFSVEALATRLGTSASTLLRTFKRELEQTPMQVLRTRRLDRALLLLKAGHRTVAETAYAVGYDNAAAFSHAFQLRFLKTPSEVQREARSARRAAQPGSDAKDEEHEEQRRRGRK